MNANTNGDTFFVRNVKKNGMEKKSLGLKIAQFPLTRIVVGIAVVVFIYTVSQRLLFGLLQSVSLSKEASDLLIGIIAVALVIVVYRILFKAYEKRTVTELSIHGIGKPIGIGLLLGSLLLSTTILILLLNGSFTVVSANPFLFIVPGFTLALTSAIFEEILLRGILFRIMEEKLGSIIALIISALIFGAMHLANPNSSLIAALAIAMEAGLLLAAAYMYTRNLWFPIAIHFAWNFTQSGIFGATVSGITLEKSLLTSQTQGAEWFTGGSFGPEASVPATLLCLIAATVLLILCYREKKFIRPFWKKAEARLD